MINAIEGGFVPFHDPSPFPTEVATSVQIILPPPCKWVYPQALSYSFCDFEFT